MDGTRKFKKAGIPYEEITRIKFHNVDTDKTYKVHLVEPVNQKDLDKYGTTILESEVTMDGDTEVIGGLKEYKLNDAPPAFQGFIADYRRRIINAMHPSKDDVLEGMLDGLIAAGIATRLPKDALPEGVGGVLFEPKDERGWKLWDKNSDMEMPWGETLRTRDGEEFELVGGTPPHKPSSAGFVRVIDDDGEKRELYPHVFDLEWRQE